MKKLIAFVLVLVGACAGCETPPPAGSPPPAQRGEAGRGAQQLRTHAIKVPGTVGVAEGTKYFVELQRDRPEAELKRPLLVEVDPRGREVGHAYLSSSPTKGFVDLDVVILMSPDTVFCYDAIRHELRWELSFADKGFDVDDVVRRGGKVDVVFAGRLVETLSLATGQKTAP